MAQGTVDVHINPPVVNFFDIKPGEVYKTTVTVTNTGRNSRRMRLHGPISKLFNFRVANTDTPIAAGLSLTGTLEFVPQKDEDVRDHLLLVSEDDTVEIPLLAFIPCCSLHVEDLADFGSVIANSQVINKEVELTNRGSAPGTFQILYSGDVPLSFSPSSGILSPRSTQGVKVELCADKPKRVHEEALVKLQNSEDVLLKIRADVVEQSLELLDSQGAQLSCLRFGPVYFGTSHLEQVVIKNDGPQAFDWVVVLQDDAIGAEVGIDLQRSTGAALMDRSVHSNAAQEDAPAVISCVPNEGRLGPYERTLVNVCFSPAIRRTSEEKHSAAPPGRQDYSLFLKFEIVGNKDCFNNRQRITVLPHTGGGRGCCVELAVTGSGLPVSLVPCPGHRFNFQQCMMGERVDILCVLQNRSSQLPVAFRFKKMANFISDPHSGTIAPRQGQDVVLSFAPRQIGKFRVQQVLEVLGQVADLEPSTARLHLRSFHQIILHLSAVCKAVTASIPPKFNPGITPAVTNETGQFVEVCSAELERCAGSVPVAVLRAAKTRLHAHRCSHDSLDRPQLIAFPNDRAASIRPPSPGTKYRTIFTGEKRYRYVDPDFAYTEEEELHRMQHKDHYLTVIRNLRKTRLQKTKDRLLAVELEEVDLGIQPAAGLLPPQLSLHDMEPDQSQGPGFGPQSHMLTTCGLAAMETRSTSRQVTEGINAVPSTKQEMSDCSQTLTAQQLHQLVIGPSTVDFGEVCVQSVSVRQLDLVNNLQVYVWVQVELDCPELQRSSPLCHVLPPVSRAALPLVFESTKLGDFHKSISYTVNKQHSGHLLVQAKVVPLALELLPSQVLLGPTHSFLAQSGYRSTVTLCNRRNHPADFTWRPIISEEGIAFSIRPATGTVEAHRELDCEVVWHPSFCSPLEGQFDLCVHQGNTARLQCVAKIGTTSVRLPERHLVFGAVPLNFTSVRTAMLQNTGHNHAYFQVLDVYPLPGMVVTPSEGVVPVGGQAEVQVHFTPGAVVKFDTRVEIALRNMKSLELRVGGSVEHPLVDISVKSFLFHGVHSGSSQGVAFSLCNRSSAGASVQFNLSEHRDFAVEFPKHSDMQLEPDLYTINIEGQQMVECILVFSPKQVAAYDFSLPVTVNSVGAPSAPPSSLPKSPKSTNDKHILTPRPQAIDMAMLSCRVQATALQAPLEMSRSSIEFDLEPLHSPTTPQSQTVELKNVSLEEVRWRFDQSAAAEGSRERLFAIFPEAGALAPGQSVCVTVTLSSERFAPVPGLVGVTLPLFLNEEKLHPYRTLALSATLHTPSITFLPQQVFLTPVPLGTLATATLCLLPTGYTNDICLRVEVEEVELESGSRVKPFSVSLPGNGPIPIQGQGAEELITCTVSFLSTQPLALRSQLTFLDQDDNRFQVEVCAVADNCLLTLWPYLALHRSEQQMVLKSGHLSGDSRRSQITWEAVLQPRCSHSPLSSYTSSSSTFALPSSTSNATISDSICDSGSERGSGGRTKEGCSERNGLIGHGLPSFPAEDCEEGFYSSSVLQAAQKWFTLFGWPGGPNPIALPQTLRRAVWKVQTLGSVQRKNSYRVSHGKDIKTIYDMLHHLSGQMLPGVGKSQSLPCNLTERVQQLFHQHTVLLIFLRAQGACLPHVRPEYLLDSEEFSHWGLLQSQTGSDLTRGAAQRGVERVDFEPLSKRAWVDVLLQTYKVLVLPRVIEGNIGNLQDWENLENIPRINPEPLSSNVYSVYERRLLTWLNLHYHNMRTVVWSPSTCKGDVPSARWVMNFDLDMVDGLVLAAVVAAYCPFLIPTHFQRMYTSSNSLEQNLHNSIILAQAFQVLCLDIDIQPTEFADPNPVMMLMLCVHLYEWLPQCLSRRNITLSGTLHGTFIKQVHVKNPSSRPLFYNASIVGKEAHHFYLPNGPTITIPPKGRVEVPMQFSSSFLRPMEALLLLTSRATVVPHGGTLSFTLRSQVTHITPSGFLKCRSPCYQLKVLNLKVTNPFSKDAKFRVILVESEDNLLQMDDGNQSQVNLLQQVTSRANQSQGPESRTSSLLEKFDGVGSLVDGKEKEQPQHTEHGDESGLNEFFSPLKSVWLTAGQSGTLEIHYLPFHQGRRYCSILLTNHQVGELVYLVKGTADLPLPSPLNFEPSPNVVQVSSDTSGPCGPEPALCLRCGVGSRLEEVLCVPLVNEQWEGALATVGQQRMTPLERQRRRLTQTLDSSSVRAGVAASQALLVHGSAHSQDVEYRVEVSLPEHFLLPETITLPAAREATLSQDDSTDSVMLVPLRFLAHAAGRYQCQLVLRSWRDVRVHLLEAVVHSEGSHAQLEFTTPAHLSVTQDIPLHNESCQDWKLRGVVHGLGFYGPPGVYVRAGERVCYPLTFCPSSQCIVMGSLLLLNDTDGTEHSFELRGVGERPLPLDYITINCPVKGVTHKDLQVPNYSQHTVTCKVVSDLSIVSGPPTMEIKPGHTVPYTVSVSPWKRGKYTGLMSFIAEGSDGENEQDFQRQPSGGVFSPYEVSFSLEVICYPDLPLKVVPVQCAVQSSVAVKIPITNPRGEPLQLQVCLEGEDLSGDTCVCIPSKGSLVYLVTFSPVSVGKKLGSVIFQSELIGEFWYQLDLLAEPPTPTTLPQCSCELGKWTRQWVPLVNPTDETLELHTVNSNPRNFTLELDSSSPLIVAPHSSTQVPVRFCPSTLGGGNHQSQISFTCAQLEEWRFVLSGVGQAPGTMDPLSVASSVGSHASLILPFRNPMESSALVHLYLTDKEPSLNSLDLSFTCETKVFCIPLKQTQGIQLAPEASVDIPVVFAPDSTQLCQAWVVVSLEPSERIQFIEAQQNKNVLVVDGCVRRVCWVYPIHGIPEAPLSPSRPAVVQCEARCRVEERVQVLLTGCVSGSSVSGRDMDESSETPMLSGSRLALEDFLCEVCFENDSDKEKLEGCVALSLLESQRDTQSGIISLTFNLIFAPYRPLRCAAALAVQCVTGGLWRFPIMLVATEPKVDDIITINAAGLHKTAAVGFRLTSKTRYPEPFTAGFLPGSGNEFLVSPVSGELLPIGSAGTLITVSFTPSMYSKRHRATLLIQTGDMHWTYEIRGTPPVYTLPSSDSSHGVHSRGPRPT